MRKVIRFLCSIPVILIALFFIPFLGIVLMIFRYYAYKDKNVYILPIILTVFGFILSIPRFYIFLSDLINVKIIIPFLNSFLNKYYYLGISVFSRRLIIIGIIFLILSAIFKNIIQKAANTASNGLKNYIEKYEKDKKEIAEKNDLKIRQEREKIKNTHLVHCPKCGADNTIVGPSGKCKYCRSEISYK